MIPTRCEQRITTRSGRRYRASKRACVNETAKVSTLRPAYVEPRTHHGANANAGDFRYWDRASSVLAAMVQLSLFSADVTSESGTSVLDRLYRRAFLPTSDTSGAITKKYLS